jgi:hypothetical protein
MDSNVMPSIVKIEKENLKNLVSEVKETVATNAYLKSTTNGKSKFSIVDLWKIQNTMRTASSPRRN